MRQWPFFIPKVYGVFISIVIVAFTSAVLIFLRANLSVSVVALLYLIPVVTSAALLGRLAGITASILSFLAFNYFFILPYYTFQATHPQDILAMVVFLGVAIIISSLVTRIQSNLAQVQAREREATQLYELSMDLAGKNSQIAIANTLARHLSRIFKSSIVEVKIFQPETGIFIRVPDVSEDVLQSAEMNLTKMDLSSPRGLLGGIHIYHLTDKMQPEEERLLHTIASQGALALDRAILTQNETKTQVLEESDRLKTAILSSVSHEMRTPLASIQAAATSLFNPKVTLEPAAREELQSLLLEETSNMIQLVGNLLNMSRIESGALKLQRQWNSISEIVDTSLRQLHRISFDHLIQVDVSEDLPLVSIDSVLMEQVLINLVRNSLKFAPPQTVVYISATVDIQALEVTVRNEGPSIPSEYLQHIFEKFYPIPGKDTIQGTGLGLSICKGIVEAHGGKIWAENLPIGIAFYFTIPLTWEGALPIIPDAEI